MEACWLLLLLLLLGVIPALVLVPLAEVLLLLPGDLLSVHSREAPVPRLKREVHRGVQGIVP